MTFTELLLKMTHNNGGTITSAEVTRAGISREYLRLLSKKGLLERSERGVYILPTIFKDEMFNLQTRFRQGIFSHNTALFLLDLTDQTPLKYAMTFPLNYNTTPLKPEKVICYRVKNELHDMGVISLKSPGGNNIRCYNAERTLCDILRGRSQTDIQVIAEAFKRYVHSKPRNIGLLSEYAKLFHVEARIRSYLEVLL